jgi:predicted transcriptional regulator
MATSARAHDKMLRIDRRTDSVLSKLAKETGRAKKDLIAHAVERMRRERLLDAMNAGFAALKRDPAAWAEELEERLGWESAVADGVEGE